MIVGLTVGKDGESIQRLAVTTKVAIGEVVRTEKGTRPNKLDHFVFLRKGAKLEWEPDPELMKHYTGTCRDVRIVLMADELENVFRTEYAWWSTTEKKCWGDGRAAIRRTKEAPDGEEWTPCGDGCPELEKNICKPSGDLYFTLMDFPKLGGTCRLHTTSYRSIRQLYSALEQIRTVTGGRLAGLCVHLVVRPEKAAYVDGDGKKKSTTIYALNIELTAQDMQKLIGEMTQHARLFDQTRKLLGNGRKVEYVAEDEPEVERAPDVAQEFYSADEDTAEAPAPTIEQPRRASEQPQEPAPTTMESVVPKAKIPQFKPDGHAPANGGSVKAAVEYITKDEVAKFRTMVLEHGWSNNQVKETCQEFWGIKASSEIPKAKFDEVWRFFASDGMDRPKKDEEQGTFFSQ